MTPEAEVAKKKVLERWPDASWSIHHGCIYDDSEMRRDMLSGDTWWKLEDAAWIDAAARLDEESKG